MELQKIQSLINQFQEIGIKHGLRDSLIDYGPRTLQVILATSYKILPERGGNDLIDQFGQEYELKTVDTSRCSAYSICASITPRILNRYRETKWLFAEFDSVLLLNVYKVESKDLEKYFSQWENKMYRKYKVSVHVKYVQKVGSIIYSSKMAGANRVERLPSVPKTDAQTATPNPH